MRYIAVLDGKNDVWGARIPDLPGVHGGGATPEAAILDVKSAAHEWIVHVLSKGRKVPRPRRLQELHEAGEIGQGEATFAVILAVRPDEGRTVKANVTFEAGLLDAIDEAAAELGITRSAFLASAARAKIDADT
jgi:predicted RNase H-like HicB family nuclease